MNVVVAIDSLKGSLSSQEAGEAIKKGVLAAYEAADVTVLPVADGGEGTIEALVSGGRGQAKHIQVCGPLEEPVQACYGILADQKTAVIEMAQAAGLPLVTPEARNPLYTTTYGVGELIKAAIHDGCRTFIVGIGGSATSDVGLGMLQALGFAFYDEKGEKIGLGGRVLNDVVRIETENALPELADCTFKIACDVDNPLFGPRGAAHIYGPQKGATPAVVEALDAGAKSFSECVVQTLKRDVSQVPGAGAAGGLGYGFLAFLNAELVSGVELILQVSGFEAHIQNADFVVTGEGRLDHQTAMGKAPSGIATRAKKHGKKVVALAGSVSEEACAVHEVGVDAYFAIGQSPMPLEVAMDPLVTAQNLQATAEQVFRLIRTVSE